MAPTNTCLVASPTVSSVDLRQLCSSVPHGAADPIGCCTKLKLGCHSGCVRGNSVVGPPDMPCPVQVPPEVVERSFIPLGGQRGALARLRQRLACPRPGGGVPGVSIAAIVTADFCFSAAEVPPMPARRADLNF